jgi:hypothetical protein
MLGKERGKIVTCRMAINTARGAGIVGYGRRAWYKMSMLGPTMNWPMAGPKASSQLCYGPPELVAGPLAPLIAGCFWVHGFGDFADGPCQLQTRRGIWQMRDGISISSRLSTLTIVELTCMLLPRDPRHPTVNFNLGEEGAKPVGLRLYAAREILCGGRYAPYEA